MDDFVTRLSEALDVEDPISEATTLDDILEWDSLGALAVASMFHEAYGVTVAGEELGSCDTVGDLRKLMESKKNNP